MLKNKKIMIALAVLLVIAIVVGIVLASLPQENPGSSTGEQPKKEVKVLPETSETVILGKAYETATKIKGEDGTEYEVLNTYVSRIANGKKVPLVYGAFDITDVLGYEITYTSESDGIEITQKHTLYVQDEGKPVLYVKPDHVACIDTKYQFPDVVVKDDSGADLKCEFKVVKQADGSTVTSDDVGFVPDAVGYYEVHISAKDNANNEASSMYLVYARNAVSATEIDALDDEGLAYTTYAMSGTVKQDVVLASLKRLESSNGSASFKSGTGATTDFYIKPRNTVAIMDALGDEGYISAWIYVSTLRDSVMDVYCSGITQQIKTNAWQELRITEAMVGVWAQYFSKLDTSSAPLFQIVNDGSDFSVYVDDIYAVKGNGLSITGVKQSYASGENITVGVEGAQDTAYSYYYEGTAKSFDGSFEPEMDGEYLITAYSKDHTALAATVVTVGDYSVAAKSTTWCVKGENMDVPALETYLNGEKVESVTKTWLVNMITGEKTLLGDTFKSEESVIALYSESEYQGKRAALLRVINLNDYAFGTWLDTDAPTITKDPFAWSNIKISWMEEYDGEKGVIAIHNTTGGEGYFNNQKVWFAAYAKEHYKRCTKLVFKMKLEGKDARLNYIAEDTWTSINVTNHFEDGWAEYSVDFSTIYDHYDGFSLKNQFWTNSVTGTDPYTIYIADIYAVVEDQLTSQTVKQNDVYDIRNHPGFEGCEITACVVEKDGNRTVLDGTLLQPKDPGFYTITVCGYDTLGLYFENYFIMDVLDANMWNSFSDYGCANRWGWDNIQPEWLATFEGAEGVLKLTKTDVGEAYYGDTNNGGNIPALLDKSAYEGATALTVRVWLEGDATFGLTLYGKEFTYVLKIFDGENATDGWQEFTVPVDVLENFDSLDGMFMHIWTSAPGTIYVDQITVVRG